MREFITQNKTVLSIMLCASTAFTFSAMGNQIRQNMPNKSVEKTAKYWETTQIKATSLHRKDDVVNAAISMLGQPYVSCGDTRDGVDCSGLVVYCYNLVGIELPHNSARLCDVGEEVAEEDIQPGDIVCWDNNGTGVCGHVGLYIGDGQCIEARGRQWGVVYCELDRSPLLTIRRLM